MFDFLTSLNKQEQLMMNVIFPFDNELKLSHFFVYNHIKTDWFLQNVFLYLL